MRQVARKGLLTAMATGSVLASTAGYAHATADAHGVAANSPGVGSGNAVQVPVELPVNACGNTINVIGLLNPAYGNNCANHSPSGSTGTTPGSTGSTTPGHGGSTIPGSGATGSDNGGTGSGGTGSGTGTGPTGTSAGGASGTSGTGASAGGTASHSPGVISGNQAQAPVDVPVNACGNTLDVIGLGNPAFGNNCGNEVTPPQPPVPVIETPPGCTPPGGECTPPETPPVAPPVTPPGTERTVVPVGGQASTPTQVADSHSTADTGRQLASTGADGLEILAPAGLLLMLGGGVLYRRSRVLARR